MSDRELIENAGVFGEELNKAAAASGLSRQSLMKGVDAMSKELSIQALKARIPEKDQQAFEVGLTTIMESFKAAAPMLLEGAKGFVSSAEGIAMSAVSPTIMNTMKLYAEGSLDATEAQNRMITEAKAQREKLLKMSAAEIDAREKAMPGFKTAYAAVMEMASKTVKSQEEINEAMAKAKRNKSIEEFYLKFSNVIELFRGKLMDTLLKSPAFTRLSGMLDNLLQGSDEKLPKLLESVISGFELMLNGISDFITDVQNPKLGWSGAMKKAYENILINLFSLSEEDIIDKDGNRQVTTAAMKKLGVMIGEAFTAVWPGVKSAIVEGFKGIWNDPDIRDAGIKGILALFAVWAAFKIGGGLISGAASRVAGGGMAASAGGGMGAGLKGLASGLTAIASPMALLGLGAVTLAILGIAKALQIAAPGFESFGTMVKRILEGVAPVIESFGNAVGTVMKDVGTAITNAKDGFEVIFNGIAKVVKTIGSVIIGSITAIGDSISKIIDTISKYKTEGPR